MSAPSNTPRARPLRDDLPVEKLSPRLLSLSSASALELAALVDREATALASTERAFRVWQFAYVRGATRRPPRWFAPRTAGVYLPRGPWSKPALATLFDDFADEPVFAVFVMSEAGREDLTALGARVRRGFGDVFTAFVPYSKLAELVRSPLVSFVHLAEAALPDLNDALAQSEIDTLHAYVPPNRGADVYVGVVDKAIDLRHPDFQDALGKPRIAHFWDQEPAPGAYGGAPASFRYGIEYSSADIASELAAAPYSVIEHRPSASDADAHGTGVLGCAGGNGRAALKTPDGSAGAGAAPESKLVFVALLGLTGSETLVDSSAASDALAYVFECAKADPTHPACVVNLSFTTDLGPHDGFDPWEVALDGLLDEPGRALTISAGNRHDDKHHRHDRVPNGGSFDLLLDHAAETPFSDDVEIWFDGADDIEIEVWFQPDPSSTSTLVPIVKRVAIGSTNVGPFDAAGAAVLHGATVEVNARHDPVNDDRCICVALSAGSGGHLPGGQWTLRLFGVHVVDGRFDAWTRRHNAGFFEWIGWDAATDDARRTVNTPATARSAVAVGNQRKSSVGGGVESESGRGPTRDERYKPDLCAVGHLIRAPRANDRSLPVEVEYRGFTGTSFAAPLVAGACALLFKCRGPTAMSGDLQSMLLDAAHQRAQSDGIAVPDDGWGFGPLDVLIACKQAAVDVDVWVAKDALDDGSEPFAREVFWQSPGIELLDATGTPVLNPTYDATARFSTRVRVTVRNRGTRAASQTEVFLAWADPATSIPYPAAWNRAGIYTGSPGFTTASNVIAIPRIAAGGFEQVEFAWAPPAPVSAAAHDGHFCLLVRVETPGDPSRVGLGGGGAIVGSNNLAMRNVYVQSLAVPVPFPPFPEEPQNQPENPPWADLPFRVHGVGLRNSLYAFAHDLEGAVELTLPAHALRWRAGLVLAATRGKRPRGDPRFAEPLAALHERFVGSAIEELTDARGARALELRAGLATFAFDARGDRLWLPILCREDSPFRARVRARCVPNSRGLVHVGQACDGRRVGGVTLAVRP